MSDAAEAKLLDVPDMGALLRREWPRLANRAALAVVLPVLVTHLAKVLDFYGPVARLGLPLEFLARGPFAYEAKIIASVVLLLLVGAYFIRGRTVQLVLLLCTAAIVWVGFIYTRLRWTRLLFDDLFLVQRDAVAPAAWALAALVLLAGLAFALVEGILDTRQAMAARELPDADVQAAARVASRSGALVLGLGAAAGAALALLAALLRPLASLWPIHLNPVFAMLLLGIILVLGIRHALGPRNPG